MSLLHSFVERRLIAEQQRRADESTTGHAIEFSSSLPVIVCLLTHEVVKTPLATSRRTSGGTNIPLHHELSQPHAAQEVDLPPLAP